MVVYTPFDYVKAIAILLLIMWIASRYLFKVIELDLYFFYAMAPVIVFAISLRVLADAKVFEMSEWWSVTPGVYITASVFAVLIVAVGKGLERFKGIPYWKGAILVGSTPAAYLSYRLFLELRNPVLSLEPVVLAAVLTGGIYIVSNFFPVMRLFREKVNVAIIFAHMLDGAATFIGIDKYGFSEEHILPEFFIQQTGTAIVMIPLKIVVVLGALYLLDKWKEEEEESDLYYKMVKFVFFIFGFGPGARDALLLTL